MPDQARYSVNLDVSTGRDRSQPKPLPNDPFFMVVAGDFRGGSATAAAQRGPLRSRSLVAVDRDDLDAVLSRFAPHLELDIGDDTDVELTFTELDHFHPDQIFARAPFFRALREARTSLADSDTFRGTLDSILGGSRPVEGGQPKADAYDVVADTLSPGSLLDQIVGQEQRGDSMQAYLRRIVAPHVSPGEDPRREAMLADLDASLAQSMRAILHHPRFQALESLWRSIDFLVRRVETSATLKIRLLDLDPAELGTDEAAAELVHVLTGKCSVLVVDRSFGATPTDFGLLLAFAAVAAHQGCALLAGAHPDLVGGGSLAEPPEVRDLTPWKDPGWTAFRAMAEAASVGLVMPRFLLRAPYGAASDPCDRIDLEEMHDTPSHDDFLWGSGAIAAAALLGESFAASGWDMRPGQHLEISGLPLFTWQGTGGSEIKPCAECLMTDVLAEFVLDAGPMVLATIRHGDAARLVRFQSLAAPTRALQGPWS